jgi:hypothetical protein
VVVKAGYWVAAALAAVAVILALVSTPVTWPYKICIAAIVVMLAGLPWIGRRRSLFGPASSNRAVATVRAGGFVGACALLLVISAVLRFKGAADHPLPTGGPRDPGFSQTAEDIELSLLFFGLSTFYAVVLTTMTSSRSRVAPRSQAIGAGLGVIAALALCALTPLGSLLHPTSPWLSTAYRTTLLMIAVAAPLVAGFVAARHARRNGASRAASLLRSTMAGLMAAAATALVLTVVTLASMMIFSGHVTPAADAVPGAGPTRSIARAVGSATGILLFVVMSTAPLVGIAAGLLSGVIGTATGGVRTSTRTQPREGLA